MRNNTLLFGIIGCGCLLIVLCVLCAGAFFIYSSQTVEQAVQEYEDQTRKERPVAVDAETGEVLFETQPEVFELGQTIRVRDAYTVMVEQNEVVDVDDSTEFYDDPFAGEFVSYRVTVTNNSDEDITAPKVEMYNEENGFTDAFGDTYDFDLADYTPYETVRPGKKYSGFVQFKLDAAGDRQDLYLEITDTNVDFFSELDEIIFDVAAF